MADGLDVLLSILLDKSARQETEKGIDSVSKKVESLESTTVASNKDMGASWDELGNDFEQFTKAFDQRFKRINSNLVDLQTGSKASAAALRDFTKIDLTQIEVTQEIDRSALAAMRLKQQTEEIELRAKAAKTQFNQISEAASKGAQVSRGILGVGVATVGGIFAFANKYAKDAIIATRETKAWNAEMALIARNGDRIGRTLVQEALPLLTQAARVTGQIASFVERNPQLIRAAIGFGSAAAVVGAVGTAVFKGIETYAKVGSIITTAQLTAAKLMNSAADKQLAAAGGMNVGGIGAGVKAGVSALAGGSAAGGSTLAFGATIAGFVALGVAIAALVNQLANYVSKVTGLSDKIEEAQRKAFEQGEASGRRPYPGINKFAQQAEAADKAAEKASESVGKLSTELGGVQNTGISQDVLDAFVNFRETALKIEESFQKDRLKLITSYNSAVTSATRANQKAVDKINADYRKTVSNILSDSRKADVRAEQEYAKQRAEIVKSAGEDIKRIEEDLQDELRKLMLDHEDRLTELVQQRDALGLVRENQRFEREQAEAQAAAQKEIARRREDVASRLSELRQNYEMEKAQRQQELQERLAEAALQHQEELKMQAEANRERLLELRQNHLEQLRELDMQHREELAHNREAFIARVRDLDAALLGEQEIRRRYYQAMLVDAQNFFARYRSALGGATTTSGSIHGTTGKVSVTGGSQSGGYVPPGPRLLHAGEYVMNPTTTRMMEQLLGGRLSENALQSFARGGGTTMNLSFPGGLVTVKELSNILDGREAGFLKMLTGAVG